MNKTAWAVGAAALLAALASSVVRAQAWPSKPIRMIVPYTPGGSSDIIARAISRPLSEALKTTVIVENRPSANGNTGTDAVAKSAAGGYTLLLCDVRALAISQKTKSDFAVTAIGSAPHLASIAVENVTGAKWEYIPYGGRLAGRDRPHCRARRRC